MFNLKKIFSYLFLLITLVIYSNNTPPTHANFFLSGEYSEHGVKINYSAIVNVALANNLKNKIGLQLTEFLIEDVEYNNKTYRGNDLFGISFPINTAVEIITNLSIQYDNGETNKKVVILHPNKKAYLSLNSDNISLKQLKIKTSDTKSIKALFEKEVFINDIKETIENNNITKSAEEIKKEYTRLMIIGNNYLNENNYYQAIEAYSVAKKHDDSNDVETQIKTTIKYAAKENVLIDVEKTARNNVDRSYFPTKNEPTKPNKKQSIVTKSIVKKEIPEIEYDDDGNEYEYEIAKSSGPVIAFHSDDLEFEYEYDDEQKKENRKNDDSNTEYEYEYDDDSNKSNANTIIDDSEYEYEYDGKAPPIEEQNTSIRKINIVQNNIPENKLKEKEEVATVEKTNDNFEVIKTKKGYIKYKKDEQAVVDNEGNILIPYGQYQIIRYRAGFARIKTKDDIKVKNIVCTNQNEEYNWSARIYENPWKETVINKDGDFVDDVVKKVEIYIVDNVSNKPNNELSSELLKKYKDPNPFMGMQQISAFNLWNRENGNDPIVIKKRNEIERLKNVSKEEAFKGAQVCHDQVSLNFEEVYSYYLNLGYEIILKD